jgi:hypothetical protein
LLAPPGGITFEGGYKRRNHSGCHANRQQLARDAVMPSGEAAMSPAGALPRRRAVAFIILLGVISLFADMTYEGARSITGPYLGLLGVTATTIGIVSNAAISSAE